VAVKVLLAVVVREEDVESYELEGHSHKRSGHTAVFFPFLLHPWRSGSMTMVRTGYGAQTSGWMGDVGLMLVRNVMLWST
jgi:hypothetical protein